ncbi:MFS transporter [Arthrobacter psychrolactophilus]
MYFPKSYRAFGAGVFLIGVASAVFHLARQSYLTEAVPPFMRARAMSTLGGIGRIGLFAGPFIGALVIHLVGLPGAYWVAALAVAAAGAVAWGLPDLVNADRSCATRAQDHRCVPAGQPPEGIPDRRHWGAACQLRKILASGRRAAVGRQPRPQPGRDIPHLRALRRHRHAGVLPRRQGHG